MIAIFSHWSKPAEVLTSKQHGGFISDYYQLVSMRLAVLKAKAQYGTVRFYTDTAGKQKFVDEGLIEFDSVHVVFDGITVDPRFWSYGKLHAISLQTVPFVHIDNDVYLLKPMSYTTGIFVQSEEPILHPAYPYYGKVILEPTVISISDPDLNSYNLLPAANRKGYNTGIIGGDQLSILTTYATNAKNLMDSLDITGYTDYDVELSNVYIEQFYLSARLYGLSFTPTKHLTDVFDVTEVTTKGYVHAIGGNKSIESVCQRIEKTYFSLL